MSTHKAKKADGVSSARAAGLRYADANAPGITRKGRGKRCVYVDARGRRIRDAKTLARIRALVLPPAWTNVWISTDPRAHLQATGYDGAGRKQYRYHANWRTERSSTKYHRMLSFAEVLPAIRRRTRRDMMGPACCRPRVLATVVELLGRTYIRIGNEEYTRKHKSHGLTTLKDSHVKVRGRKLHFAFRGKSGVFQSIEIEEPRLAKAVREVQDLPGQTLFQYRDDHRRVRSLSSTDVNSYLREVTGAAFTAKDFRTWAGTLAAAQALDKIEHPESKTAVNRAIVKAIDCVAEALGNTRAVCRGSYIHPAVIESFRDRVTLSGVTAAATPRGLLDAEARLVSLLRRAGRARKAA
ncbi:MAG: DNA topoisomerase IB [Cyanobacteria bacterium]|nr:DNA topoisomerase IB [Cyanobacteriota bacterium]